jgi:plastocyanin
MKLRLRGEATGMKKFTRGFILSAIAAGALVACVIKLAVADGYAASPSPAPAASPSLVTIKDFGFSPSTVKIHVGDTVRWKNNDSVSHTATSTSKGFDSGNLDNGQSFSFTFTKSGSYSYVCSYHPSMTGIVIVTDAPSPAPAH